MLRCFAILVFCTKLLGGSAIADKPHPEPAVGDFLHIDLIGDAALKYARLNGFSLDDANSPIPMLSMSTLIRSIGPEPEIYIEHQFETSVEEKRYLCTLKGVFPSKCIHVEPVLDLTQPTTSPEHATDPARTLGHNLRLRITDFSILPQLKLQRWQMIEELVD